MRAAACVVLATFALAACADDDRADSRRVLGSASPRVTATTTASSSASPVSATSSAAPRAQPLPRRTAVVPPPPPPVADPVVPGAEIGGCPLFPPDNPWRRDVSRDPVHPNSANFIASISESRGNLHPDWGSNTEYGIPYVVVPENQRRVPINFTDYPDESDPGPYPVPLDAPVEAGGDRHVLVAQRGECKLFELYDAERSGDGWNAASGAIFDLRSNKLRPDGWTSADAAGLPILPGLVRYDEVSGGAIRHALRFTAQRTQRGYIHPATHYASSDDDPNLPPMGLRLRLKASYDISRFTGHARVVLEALRTYGMLLADNGSSWFISGATDSRWNDDDVGQLKSVPGSAFEAVQSGEIRR